LNFLNFIEHCKYFSFRYVHIWSISFSFLFAEENFHLWSFAFYINEFFKNTFHMLVINYLDCQKCSFLKIVFLYLLQCWLIRFSLTFPLTLSLPLITLVPSRWYGFICVFSFSFHPYYKLVYSFKGKKYSLFVHSWFSCRNRMSESVICQGEMFWVSVESPCLHRTENWLMRQLTDLWGKAYTQSRIH
jgi:hypothetical protein